MFDFLESLRNKSEHTRRVIAASISLAITLAIGVVWGTVSFSRIQEERTIAQVRAESTPDAPSPFAAIKENTARAFQGIKEQFTGITTVFYATTSTTSAQSSLAAPAAAQPVSNEEYSVDKSVVN